MSFESIYESSYNKKTMLVMRTHGTRLEALSNLCELLDKHDIMCAPIVFPFCFPLEAFSIDKKFYDLKKVLSEARKNIGLKNVPLLIISNNPAINLEVTMCDKEDNACILVMREDKIQDKTINKVIDSLF